MKKEEFIALGLDEKLAEKAAEESKKELSGYIPKSRFDEVNEAKKQLESTNAEYEKQLESLKSATGDSEELKKQIAQLQEQNKEKETEYKEKIKDLQITNAIKAAVMGSVHDEELVAGLFDKTKLILGEDGKVSGLEEQVKQLKESKGFLFKEPEKRTEPTKEPFVKIGANAPETSNDNGKVSMKQAIQAKIQAQIPTTVKQ